MKPEQQTITFIGAGAIGTAMGNILAANPLLKITLHSIDKEAVRSISETQINSRAFPSIPLHPALNATTHQEILRHSSIIFLTSPSVSLIDYQESIRKDNPDNAILVNLAKKFGAGNRTICACLTDRFPNPVCTLKGPSFAREIINRVPTGLTLGYTNPGYPALFREIFSHTTIDLDYTSDITGVEILSILKHIYAIVLGIVDAQFDSPNLRFLVLTKAFREMRKILLHFGGNEQTLFNYCGYGDFTLTALNDLSRNRTLGLLIGKGFFTEHVSHELVLEGKTATTVFYSELAKSLDVPHFFPIFSELHRIFTTKYEISSFVHAILSSGES